MVTGHLENYATSWSNLITAVQVTVLITLDCAKNLDQWVLIESRSNHCQQQKDQRRMLTFIGNEPSATHNKSIEKKSNQIL